MIKSTPVTPYRNGRPRFKERGRAGVYIISDHRRVVYVGHSKTDLYKTMYRHFQSWPDSKQVRITYDANNPRILVRVVYTNTPSQAAALERALIVKYEPRDNPQKLIDHTTTDREENLYHEFKHTPTDSIKHFEGETPF